MSKKNQVFSPSIYSFEQFVASFFLSLLFLKYSWSEFQMRDSYILSHFCRLFSDCYILKRFFFLHTYSRVFKDSWQILTNVCNLCHLLHELWVSRFVCRSSICFFLVRNALEEGGDVFMDLVVGMELSEGLCPMGVSSPFQFLPPPPPSFLMNQSPLKIVFKNIPLDTPLRLHDFSWPL